jgi:hypothetical protein
MVAVPQAQAATSAKTKALRYVVRAQNKDGGFGGAAHQSSSPLYTGWVTLGIAAAGENPRDVRNGKATPVSYARGHLPKATAVGELERTILMLRAAGTSVRDFGHRDLSAELKALRSSDGSWERLADHTAFGILALRAAGDSPAALRSSALWLERQQNHDGGFGFGRKGGSSDADDTGSSIQALVAAGRGRKSAVRKAVAYLRHAQNPDGGFGQMKQDDSNAQSTSWAIQGLVAAHVSPGSLRRNGHTPVSYITSLQQANGAIRYSRTSAQTPVWVTGQALTALARKPFPVRAPKRRAPVAPASTTTAKPKTSHKSSAAPPVAHAAHKAPKSHGQTISPAKRPAQPTTMHNPDPTMTSPSASIAPPHRRPVPSTAHGQSSGHRRDLVIALGAIAAVALLAGAYLTRRRLRGRSSPA